MPSGAHRCEVDVGGARPVEPGAHQRPRLPPVAVAADQTRGVAQELAGVVGAAVHQVLPQAVTGLGADGRKPRQLGVRLIIAGQERQFYSLLAADADHFIGAVGPVAAPAQ